MFKKRYVLLAVLAVTATVHACSTFDLNCDGWIDLQDFVVLSQEWLEETGTGYSREDLYPTKLDIAPRRPNYSYVPKYIDLFNEQGSGADVSIWHPSTNCILEYDYNNVVSGGAVEEPLRSIESQIGKSYGWSGSSSKNFGDGTVGNGLDVSGSHIMCRFYIHKNQGQNSWENIWKIHLVIYTTLNRYSVYQMWYYDSNGANPGWNTYTGTYGDYIGEGEDGPADMSDVWQIKLVVYRKDDIYTQQPSVTFDQLEFIPKLKKGLLMLRFDDGYAAHLRVAEYLSSKGLRGTFAVFGGADGIDTSYKLTLDQLKQIHSAGHLIINHTYNHVDWDEATDKVYISEVLRNEKWMFDNGFVDGMRMLATPYGRWHENSSDVLTGLIDFLWLTRQAGAGDLTHVEPLYNPRVMRSSTIGDCELLTHIDAITDAGQEGAVGMLIWHKIGTCPTWEQFEMMIDEIADLQSQGDIMVVTPFDILTREFN